MKIGIVEDNQLIGEMLQNGLSLSGNEVIWYRNAQECLIATLEAWFSRSILPDILVSDLDLGQGIDGAEMIKRLREFIRPADLPVLIMSGRDLIELNLVSQGFFDIRILRKPVTPTILLKEIRRELATQE